LKFGKGVQVEAQDNSQLRLYALGAWNEFEMLYDIETVRMTIMQPRLNHISTDEMKLTDLVEWADGYVKPRADMAANGEGEFLPGEHCRFCKARFTCRARAKETIEADGSKRVLKARDQKNVQSTTHVAKSVIQNIQRKKFITVLTSLGKLNAYLQPRYPLAVEKIILRNLDKFEERSQ
jgi:hypothetical protein